MNRLVIIGNGFDLAHGLPTGYCDFIDDYWKNVINKLKCSIDPLFEDRYVQVHLQFKKGTAGAASNDFQEVNTFHKLKQFIEKHSEAYDRRLGEENYNRCKIKFHNVFFKVICDKRAIQNWVDVENEYYKILKECLKYEDNSKVKRLNHEFDQVKKLLEDYLHNEVVSKFDCSDKSNIGKTIEIFNLNSRLANRDKFLMEFEDKMRGKIITYLNKKESPVVSMNKKVEEKNLFLNFNYTATVDIYVGLMIKKARSYGHSEIIQIHGKLKDIHNPINFGFGDEMDDDYKTIEKKDDNEYLRNIKSFQYLQTSNYKKMLSFIESDPFQVYVMGHSCGLSDRILLNKIFEHVNCLSIKVFYYKGERGDNYTELIQNISRHFNKKEMMREKIVNKTLCEPLPQMQLPLKENGPKS